MRVRDGAGKVAGRQIFELRRVGRGARAAFQGKVVVRRRLRGGAACCRRRSPHGGRRSDRRDPRRGDQAPARPPPKRAGPLAHARRRQCDRRGDAQAGASRRSRGADGSRGHLDGRGVSGIRPGSCLGRSSVSSASTPRRKVTAILKLPPARCTSFDGRRIDLGYAGPRIRVLRIDAQPVRSPSSHAEGRVNRAGIAYGAGSLWLALGPEVARIDPEPGASCTGPDRLPVAGLRRRGGLGGAAR